MKAYQKGSGSGEPIKNGNKSWTVRQPEIHSKKCLHDPLDSKCTPDELPGN